MSDFTEQDLRAIERDRDLPTDESHSRYANVCPKCGSDDIEPEDDRMKGECFSCGAIWGTDDAA